MAVEKVKNDIFEEAYKVLEDGVEQLNKDFNEKFIKPNIVLSGKTGVGKSTLINAVFGRPLADAGEGKPVSQALIEYSIPEVSVNLFDTKGIELDPVERKVSRESIVNKIKERASSSDVKDHMHVMWYCISNESKRIEDVEIEWVKEFSEYMHVIIVLTQTIENSETFQKEIEKELPEIQICRVLSEERQLIGDLKIPAHGLDKLVSETVKLLPDATKRAFTAAQKIKVEEKIESAKNLLQDRMGKYKNLAHLLEGLPIGVDIAGKAAIYLYIAHDIMKVMGIPVAKNYYKFAKYGKPLLQSIIIPFVVAEGGKGLGKTFAKEGGGEIGKKLTDIVIKLFGKNVFKGGSTIISPIVGFIFGTFNRKITEKIANAFIDVCAEFLRNEINYENLSEEEILEILSVQMNKKMIDIQDEIEQIVEDDEQSNDRQ
ncbi:hypothetical protein JMA_26830 [Jeotgalibacillus malaysiensis]|uniref:G domain-containing protein n=1 Tax=Jeotgalibacillus malaysiensis TaxID=1508404 RepID=A0A0B5AP04_9BACL|nr:GTPase [Jeotgalibacillus malaysiensis]AJD92000.1 hypothetical protein JMA_26830 [Jeotgalibacillus malaysiensis]